MCLVEDGSAGSLIYTAGLHTYHTVLYDITDADSMLAAKLVELADNIGYLHFFAVDTLWNTLFKCHRHIFAFIRRLLRCNTKDQQMVIVRLVGRILKFQAFMADVPEVAVAAVAVACVEWKVDAVLLAVFDLFFAGIHGPYIRHSPWSDDLKIRRQRLDAKLETDLVVTLAGCTVADCRSAFLSCNLNQCLSDRRTCHRGSEQVFILVDSVSLYAWYDIVIAEIINDILDIELGSTGQFRPLF